MIQINLSCLTCTCNYFNRSPTAIVLHVYYTHYYMYLYNVHCMLFLCGHPLMSISKIVNPHCSYCYTHHSHTTTKLVSAYITCSIMARESVGDAAIDYIAHTCHHILSRTTCTCRCLVSASLEVLNNREVTRK